MNIYTSYGVAVKPTGGELTMIGGVQSQSIALGTEHNAEVTAGSTRPQSSEITAISPRGNFSCFDVATLLELIGSEGSCISGGAAEGFALYQLKLDACGAIASGDVHRKIIIPNGMVVPRSLSVGHRSNAVVNAEVIALFDGTNDPVIVPALVAAPTGLTDVFRFTLGAVTVGGVALEGNTSIEVNFGVDVQTDGGDSDIYDTNLITNSIKPEITITTRDVAKFGGSGIGLKGIHGTHANSTIVLSRRVNGTGEFSEDADSIEITFDGLISVDSAHSSSGNQRGEMTVKITALDDGTNAPLVFDYAHDLAPE